jgi:transketolase C-terminal domain/subunit
VEEHSIVGGFGSACLEKLAGDGGIHFSYTPIGIPPDTFGDTGGYAELLDAYGLSAEKIAEKIKKNV